MLPVSSFSLGQNTLFLRMQFFSIINFQLASSLKSAFSSVQAVLKTYTWQGHLRWNNYDIIWKYNYHLGSKAISIIMGQMADFKDTLNFCISFRLHLCFNFHKLRLVFNCIGKKDAEKEQKTRWVFFFPSAVHFHIESFSCCFLHFCKTADANKKVLPNGASTVGYILICVCFHRCVQSLTVRWSWSQCSAVGVKTLGLYV